MDLVIMWTNELSRQSMSGGQVEFLVGKPKNK